MKRVFTGVFVIFLLVTLSVTAAPASILAQPPFINVRWGRVQETENFTHDGVSQEWIFGESPKLVITFDNGTNIGEKGFRVSRGDILHFTMVIPKGFFEEEGTELESVQVGASMYNETVRAELFLEYIASSEEQWNVFSEVYDSMAEDPVEPEAFFEFDPSACAVTEDEHAFNVTFVGAFNTSAPTGVYQTWAQIMDNEGNFIHPGWFYYSYAGEIPLPPIALECSTEMWGFRWQDEAQYEVHILDGNLQPIRYAEAGDILIFEMTMTRPIGYAAFSLGYVSMKWEHKMNVTYIYPDNPCSPNTTWSSEEHMEYPKLGFTFNASTGEIQALLFYENWTWIWREWDNGYGNWELRRVMIPAQGLNLDMFFNFDKGASGPVNATTVRWQGSLTDKVMEHDDPNPTYSAVFHIYAWDPVDWGSEPEGGGGIRPSEEFARNDGVMLAYHDFIVDGFITSPAGDIIDQVDHNEPFNLSLYIHASSDLVEYQEGPYHNGSIWTIENFTMKSMVVCFYGNAHGWNETHYWNLYAQITVIVDVEVLSVVWQSCSVVNETWSNESWEPVSREEWNTTSNVMDITGVFFTIGEKLTLFGFQARFLDLAPDAQYYIWTEGYQNHTIYSSLNQNGPWTLDFNDTMPLWLGCNIFWTPTFLTLGTAWSWVPEKWTVTKEGALDLDGDLSTVDDQYFVKHVFHWIDEGSWTENSLHVDIYFDPTPGDDGDEFISRNWMGLVTETITFTWNESFYWYHAADGSRVGEAEMEAIRELVWSDVEEEVPAPGYYAIAWMTVNRTWEDIVEEEWWWLEDNTWEYSWFGFGTEQEFQVSSDINSTTWAWFRSEFAGLLLFIDNATYGANGVPDFAVHEGFVDSDETTHFFIIEHVGSIEFLLPFNSNEPTGEKVISVDETVDFGVRIYDVNGTLFPVHTRISKGIHGCWDYMGSADVLIGLNVTDFDYMVESATIDELSFEVHYSTHMAGTPENPDPYNHRVEVKVDQYVGNWYLHHFDNSVLEGRGLAIAYFAQLSTETYAEFKVGETPVYNNNDDTQIGDIYNFGIEGRTVASVHMGGQTYVWGKDGQTYNCSAATVPMGAFSAMFESTAGTTVTRWTMESNFYFMISGFTNWDGYSIDNDPTFGVYTTALKTIGGPPLPAAPIIFLAIVAAIVIIIVAVAAVNIRRRQEEEPQPREPVSDYWSQTQRWG